MQKMTSKSMPMKGKVPAGYADGGKLKPFPAKEAKGVEMAEAKMVRSGKLSLKSYMAAEKAEQKKEGAKFAAKMTLAIGKSLASGKLTPKEYAAKGKKMANGGKVVKKMGC